MKRINMSVVLIPSIDIFVLIATFLALSGNFLYRSVVKVKLPSQITRDIVARDNPTVTLTPGGAVFLNGRKVTKEGLSVLLRLTATLADRKGKESLLIIRADENVPYKDIVEVIGIARDSGMEQIAIATGR